MMSFAIHHYVSPVICGNSVVIFYGFIGFPVAIVQFHSVQFQFRSGFGWLALGFRCRTQFTTIVLDKFMDTSMDNQSFGEKTGLQASSQRAVVVRLKFGAQAGEVGVVDFSGGKKIQITRSSIS
jgi:hypothetical protein